VPADFQPIQALPGVGDLPLLLVRVEREQAAIAETVAAFITAAADYGASFEVIDVVGGQHGFDILDHNDDSRHGGSPGTVVSDQCPPVRRQTVWLEA
jgi:hypothetical protein